MQQPGGHQTPDYLHDLADELHTAAELVQLELESAHALLCTVDHELANGSHIDKGEQPPSNRNGAWHNEAIVAVRTLLVRLKIACGYQAAPGGPALQSLPAEVAPSPARPQSDTAVGELLSPASVRSHQDMPQSPYASPSLEHSVISRSPGASADAVLRRALVASQAQINALQRQLDAAHATVEALHSEQQASLHNRHASADAAAAHSRVNGAHLLAQSSSAPAASDLGQFHSTARTSASTETYSAALAAPSLPSSPGGSTVHARTPGVRWAPGVSPTSQRSQYHSVAPTPAARATSHHPDTFESAGTYRSGHLQRDMSGDRTPAARTPAASHSVRSRGSAALSSGRTSSVRPRKPLYWSAGSSSFRSPALEGTASTTREYLKHSARKSAGSIAGRRLAAATPTVAEEAVESSPSDAHRAGASRGSTRMRKPLTPGAVGTLAQRLMQHDSGEI